MVKLKTREAVIGLVVYRAMRFAAKRYFGKGGFMAGKKKMTLLAALGALLGALFFWRKRRARQSEF
jgi:hypothetical protein